MYRITYIGVHTCQRTSKLSPQIITDTDPWEVSDISRTRGDNSHVRVPTTVKQEYFKEDALSGVTEKGFSPPPGSIFEREAGAVRENDFSSLDMDDWMASYAELDAGDFLFDEIGDAL